MTLTRSAVVLAGIAAALFLPLSAGSAVTAPVFGDATPVGSSSGTDLGLATELETGDLNGDGLADVVIARISYPLAYDAHPIGIMLADGHGGYTDGSSMWDGPPPRTQQGRQILIADFNGDGRNDIFVADHGYDANPYPGHANALALSTPQGKLVDASGNLPPESGFSHSAAAADVNGDGSIDIYVGNLCCGDGTPPEILLNDGTGHFTRRLDLLPSFMLDNYGPHRYTRSLFVDVNGDHSPDLVVGADDHTPDSRVLLNDGTGHFHDAPASLPPKPFGANAILISLATLDVNGDGKPDLLAGFTRGDPFYQGRYIQVLIGNGDGTFRDETAQRLAQQQSGDGWPYAIRVADFNGDGHPDFAVVVNGADSTDAAIYLDDGTGTYHLSPFVPAYGLFGIVDANGDGRPDVFSSGTGNTLEPHSVQFNLVAPAAPTRLRATATPAVIRLTWTKVAGATGYEVWRSAGTAPKKRVARTAAAAFVDRSARRGVVYRYAVRATNDAGAGPFSVSVAARRR